MKENITNMPSYVVIEGRDGSGKTTLAKHLAELTLSDFEYEPCGETDITKMLREFCLDKSHYDLVNWRAREYMMLANRAISTKRVHDKLMANKTVICDRSLVSGMVYARVASGVDFETWWSFAKEAFWVKPEMIIYVTPNRFKINKVAGDIYDNEKDDFHKAIAHFFPLALEFFSEKIGLQFMNFENDFDKTPDENAHECLSEIKRTIFSRGGSHGR